LTFVGTGSGGKNQVWVQPLNSLEARSLPGTEDVRGTPFWAPDSRSIAFFTVDKLKRIDASGGSPQMLCDYPATYNMPRSGAWNREGVVIFNARPYILYRASASGGGAVPLTKPDEKRRESSHWFPEFLPDGRHFLFFVRSEDPEHAGVRVGSLDSPETRPLLQGGQPASYAWPGYLFVRQGRALLARPFEANRLAFTGEPSLVAEAVDSREFSASETGALAFASSGPEIAQPTWFDRGGKRLGTIGEPGPYTQIALSPDGRQAAVQRIDPGLVTSDIWLLDLARGVLSRFTFDPGVESDPVWSPDGRRLAFSANENKGPRAIFQKELSGAAQERVLPKSAASAFVEAWSRDGRFLFYGAGIGGRDGLWAVHLGDGKAFPVVQSPSYNDEPQLSPDGRFLAYMSSESGQFEVYAQAFPGPGPRSRISTGGGGQPRWRADGRELFYLTPDGTLMAVGIKALATLEPGTPRRLFSTAGVSIEMDQYAVTADGQRFLVLVPAGDATSSPITVVLNWTAGLKK
jgi:Tol biopolymer transport system component